MKLPEYLNNCDIINEKIYKLLISVKKCIYISTLILDPEYKFYNGHTINSILTKKKMDGVKINIYCSNNRLKINNKFANEIKDDVINSFGWGEYLPYTDIRAYCNHRKYILVDDKYFIIGGCMISNKYNGGYGIKKINNEYYIHESAVYIELEKTDTNIIDFIKGNKKISFPLFDETTLEEKYIDLIKNSKKSIYIENQYICSYSDSVNNIFNELKKRLHKSFLENDDLIITIVGNDKLYDDDNFVLKHIYSQTYSGSASKLCLELKELNIPESWINERCKLLYLTTSKDEPVFIHNKIMQVDDKVLFTTGNLTDRSMIPGRDKELGIILKIPNLYRIIDEKGIKQNCIGNPFNVNVNLIIPIVNFIEDNIVNWKHLI